MILNLLNEKRELVDIVTHFEQLLWTRKYNDVGGCVLTMAADKDLLYMLLNEVKYISRDDDTMVCEISKIALNVDKETGKKTIVVTGLDVVNILNRRIVWSQSQFSQEEASDIINNLVYDSIASPSDDDRRVIHFKVESGGRVEGKVIDKQITYDKVLDAIKELCQTYNFGFRVILKDNKNFVFQQLRRVDHSIHQQSRDHIVFSANMNNLNSLDWEIDYTSYNNVALVGGEGEGTERKVATVGTATGINRYEMFVEAKSVSSEKETISENEYTQLLIENGKEALAKQQIKQTVNCSIDVGFYKYREDFDVGYIVTVEDNDFGITFDATIDEVVETEDINGYRVTVNLKI